MMRVNLVIVRQWREASVSLFIFEISRFSSKTESKERVGNVVDGQQRGILEFALGVPQHQVVNHSFSL